MTGSEKKMYLLPTTKEGWRQMEYTMVGVVVATLMGFSVLVGMKIGWNYGIAACVL